MPFFYGWVILACVCLAGFARQGPAVATLSIFVEPMTRGFGWSRTALSGAVSLGGVLAASPLIGPVLDRRGARLILGIAVCVTGVSTMLLSATQSLTAFYALFCLGRMNFAATFDLGIYGALNGWFVARRAFVTSIANLAQMAGLVVLPLLAHLRTSTFWLLSLYTLVVYPVQAGVSLHQAPYLVERGLSAGVAATIVSSFSLVSGLASLAFGLLTRRMGARAGLGLTAAFLGVSAAAMLGIATPLHGYLAAGCFGLGIGGLLTVLPLAWADYVGRASYGAIRGVALTVQVSAQASIP